MLCNDEVMGNRDGGRLTVLTCKSLVTARHRGERLIEPSGSWLPLKFPSGLLEFSIHRFVVWGRAMQRGIGEQTLLNPAANSDDARTNSAFAALTSGLVSESYIALKDLALEYENSLWANTGKQYWRCGMIRKADYGA